MFILWVKIATEGFWVQEWYKSALYAGNINSVDGELKESTLWAMEYVGG